MKRQRVAQKWGSKQFRELVEEAMGNYKFYKNLKKNPAAALKGLGLDPTPEQIRALKKIKYKSLEACADAFGSETVI